MTIDEQFLNFEVKWEGDISIAEHTSLARLLASAFPLYADTYTGSQSWCSARPELRVVASLDGEPVAHLGLLRRFLRIPNSDTSILVGDVGLVGVQPEQQKQGIGRLLLERTTQVMTNLDLPFGFLTCYSELAPFYEEGGWEKLGGQVVRIIDEDQQVKITESIAMTVPIKASLSEWPYGQLLERNGWEV